MEKALERLEDTSNQRRRWKTVCKVARRRDGEQRVAGGGPEGGREEGGWDGEVDGGDGEEDGGDDEKNGGCNEEAVPDY